MVNSESQEQLHESKTVDQTYQTEVVWSMMRIDVHMMERLERLREI